MSQTTLTKGEMNQHISDFTSSLTRNEPNKENITLLWFDPNIGLQIDTELTQQKLRSINDFVTFHTDLGPCVEYIKLIKNEKIFLITSGSKASEFLPLVSDLHQIDCIFIFCRKKDRYQHLINDYQKIIDIYVDLNDLCSSIRQQIELFDKQLQTFSTFDHHQKSTKDLSKQSAEFLWFQLYHYLVIRLPQNKQSKQQMIDICRYYYRGNTKQLNLINQFEQEYCSQNAIHWYTKQSFVYELINKALRTEDLDQLQNFRFFISDLSKNLAREHEKILLSNQIMLNLYRGSKLNKEEFEKLKESLGKVISTNGYLSTSRCRESAMTFAEKPTKRPNIVNVLFEIECPIQQLGKSVLYADVACYSEFPDEKEVLFDLNASFRLNSIKEIDSIQYIRMTVSDEGEKITKKYIELLEKDTEENSIIVAFGRLMCDLGEYDKALKYFEELLIDPNGEDIAWIEFNIGKALDFKGEWEDARKYYDKAYDRMIMAVPARIQDSAHVISNIGGILYRQGKYDDAFDFHQRALKIRESLFPSGHVDIAQSLNYIGLILDQQGKYDEALKYLQRALKIREKFYPLDHIYIAASVNNIGFALCHQRKYDEALHYSQRALEMRKKFYPSGHIETAKSLTNIGRILECQKKYNESIDCHQQALKIREKFYPYGHSSTATSINNIGSVLNRQGKYDEALKFCTKALEMREKLFPSEHVYIADSLKNVGECYENQNKKKLALKYYRRALAIYEKFLPVNHPRRIKTERNIRRIPETD